jgi:hypothetical protein
MKLAFALIVFAAACGGSPKPSTKSSGAAPSAEAADFQMICDAATRAAADSKSADDKRNVFASMVDAKLKTDGARNTWKSAAQATDDKKLAALQQGASELKVASWDCPAIASIYGAQAAGAVSDGLPTEAPTGY